MDPSVSGPSRKCVATLTCLCICTSREGVKTLFKTHACLECATLDTGVESPSVEKLSYPTHPPEPGVWCWCRVRRDGGREEGNCVTTLQLVRVYEPAVAPCCATLLGINIHSEGKWTSAASLAGK